MMVGVAGALCLLLAGGHTLVGRSVLPAFRKQPLPASSLGGPATTAIALTVTWYFVTIAVTGLAVLLLALAGRHGSAERSLVLRTVSGVFTAAAVLTVWLARRRPRRLLRSPVAGFIAVAALCAVSA